MEVQCDIIPHSSILFEDQSGGGISFHHHLQDSVGDITALCSILLEQLQ
jgi:hypothetical protein